MSAFVGTYATKAGCVFASIFHRTFIVIFHCTFHRTLALVMAMQILGCYCRHASILAADAKKTILFGK
jgi:hypothetical protein